MSSRKIILLSFGLLFLLISELFADTKDNQKIEISISLDKYAYLIREPIWLDISATNLADTDISLLPLLPECLSCIQIELKDSQRSPMRYDGMIADYVSGFPHKVRLRSNEALNNVYNLLNGFGERVNNWPIRRFLRPGAYTVQVLYQNKISSNTLEFKVEAPKGDEEKAYQLISEGISYLFSNQRDKLVAKLKELVTQYPKSTYAELAYYEMLCWDKDKARAKQTATKLILDYPNSGFVKDAFWELLTGKNKEGRKKVLRELIDKRPGTRLAETAKKSLEALESKKD